MNQRIIYYDEAFGTLSVVVPAIEIDMDLLASKVVPVGKEYEIVNDTDIPSDMTFRDCWEHDKSRTARKVKINMPKAKEVVHEKRRKVRSAELAPLDVEATIPDIAVQAENKRKVIRAKYDQIQTKIDTAKNEAELLKIYNDL